MTLHDRRRFRYRGNGERVPLKLQALLPYVPATLVLRGARPLAGRFLVDTGANATAETPAPFLDSSHLSANKSHRLEAKAMKILERQI
ncbi:MAG: hypothetical protein FJ398_10500 [Verrucomicrobia bacterium]|nr:hypothetical protein [Verrucomicrobiota bacterium]